MLTVDELLKKTNEYHSGQMSLEQFENWFEDNSFDVYDTPIVRDLCAAVDGALAEYHFDYIGEDAFREELARATM